MAYFSSIQKLTGFFGEKTRKNFYVPSRKEITLEFGVKTGLQ